MTTLTGDGMTAFKFIIRRPLREAMEDKKIQSLQIFTSYPNIVYSFEIALNKAIGEEEQISLAVAELKIDLMKQIVNAKFEFEAES